MELVVKIEIGDNCYEIHAEENNASTALSLCKKIEILQQEIDKLSLDDSLIIKSNVRMQSQYRKKLKKIAEVKKI